MIWNWVKAWFDPRSFGASNGVSLSRRLMALWVIGVLGMLIYALVAKRDLTASWAAVATGVATTLAGIWGVSKVVKRGDQP